MIIDIGIISITLTIDWLPARLFACGPHFFAQGIESGKAASAPDSAALAWLFKRTDLPTSIDFINVLIRSAAAFCKGGQRYL